MEFGKEKEGTALYSPISRLNNCKVEETREQYDDNQLLIETKKLQNCCINKEASSSIGVKDEKGNNDHISKHKVGHVTPFPRLRDSELMVSMFAKRLGAIKQCQQPE
ncbi:putative zinc knuckle family protein [Trifolium medium]|uniref:Putative zinc knuckle family protein n=1 Tax=Trifolium medium TaxID=97028 RepID=A0A392PWR3_9FABA|nr:putative zinc knuckle family protein [Trifolium medium]